VDASSRRRAEYSSDASNYRLVPQVVVFPRAAEEVALALQVARDTGTPLVARGAGTSCAGNAVSAGILLDFSRAMNRLVSLDPDSRTAVVQPGLILADLQRAAAPHGLTFGPDPSTHSRCTLGGMIGNNSCGAHSVAWGTTLDNVIELDVLRYDGGRMTVGAGSELPPELRALVDENLALLRTELGRFGRQVSGFPLHQLLPEHGRDLAKALVGTEGTCVTVLGARLRLVELPATRVLLVLGFADDVAAADAVPAILPHRPLTVESMDERIVALRASRNPDPVPTLPPGGAWLFVEVDGLPAATAIASTVGVPHEVITDAGRQRELWRLREEGSGISTRLVDGAEAWPGWEDTAVPPERLGAYLRDLRALLAQHGLRGLPYGHFGEGCIHIRVDFDLVHAEGVARFRRFVEEAADLVVRHGGTLSGEHGDGQVRAELLPRMYSPRMIELFARFKAFWDPAGRMNPGMVVRPYRVDENLRFVPLAAVRTAFTYPRDSGDFGQAARRCIGVAKCRNHSGSVMCPSFQVTGEEKHSTRGRARLLYEMLAGEVITDGWRSTEVRDALDLCLSCKGCKSDCPVNVDMATYKAEFLHHHYKRRLRPASHYSMGWLPLWLRLASRLPRTANRAMASPRLSRLLKRLGGIAPERALPPVATETLTHWLRHNPGSGGQPVVLWPDTFTNFFTPSAGIAAVRVLRAAGFDPVLPPGSVCCGLTWVSTGQLSVARKVMRRTLRALAPFGDTPVVGLEPSCLSALNEDLPELTGTSLKAFTLAGFLTAYAPQWTPPVVSREAITQVHCHQHATLGVTAEKALLAKAGVRNSPLPAGCCGLAGNFGFEREHYEVSQALAERALLPAVREAAPDTLVIADGFSCRTQIAQGSDREAVHLAEVLAEGL
ncbi:FAD-binding and (Fe-S)-binding domain-containing protein, partial [Actinophytocola sp.]|uniref:FAD-binding and (Fe-S)-binding domain-containing protein n=1 Tax=Actinophytocola sp. TaxID=1872138 RepID=UPI00389A0511